MTPTPENDTEIPAPQTQTNPAATGDTADPAAGPPSEPSPVAAFAGSSLWMLRILALAGLVVGLFLAGVHLARLLVVQFSEVPFCGFAPNWFDCSAVLFDERWSEWLGVPVAFPAAALYAVVTVAAFALNPKRSPAALRRLWAIMQFAAVAIALAAAWFILVQAQFIDAFCLYCMIEHAIGLVLAFQVWALSFALRGTPAAPGRLPKLLGLAAVLALISGQSMNEPTYSERMIGEFTENAYDEAPESPEHAVSLAEGSITLDEQKHLYLGEPDAPHVIVEVVDYTCPNCRDLYQNLKRAKADLGPDYAVMVITFPLNGECNHLITYDTGEKHADACHLAKLAHAVWLVDEAEFPAFHNWLFENQDAMTRKKAQDKASELVGHGRLMGRMTLKKLDNMIKRDAEIGRRLGVRQLPGLYAGPQRFSSVPSDPTILANALRDAFESSGEANPATPTGPESTPAPEPETEPETAG